MSKRTSTTPVAGTSTFSSRFWTEVRGYAEALVIAYLVVTFLFNTVGVVGSSMRPNLDGGVGSQNVLQSLLTGDRVFIPKYDTWLRRMGILGPYSRGDVVVVREPANSPTAQERDSRPFFIKRVIGVPGDRIRIEAGQVFVNDFPLDQSFITASGEITPDPVNFPVVVSEDGQVTGFVMGFNSTLRGTAVPDLPRTNYTPPAVPLDDPRVQLYYGSTIANLAALPAEAPDFVPLVTNLVIPADHYFVMGDNRQSSKGGSEDSRYFGPVRQLTIAGKATSVIWPPRRDGQWNWRLLRPPPQFAAIPDSGN
jgi:signal peptidase I